MTGHTIVITGANRGIGLELARLFGQRGDRVIALCRTASPALAQTGATVIEGVDVAAADGPESAAAELGDTRVDVLINNAGILSQESFEALGDAEALEQMRRQFEVNTLGPLRMTHALADQLGRGSKVALITSRMGSIADNDSGGSYGYRMSKAALNAGGRSLALDLAPRGIAVGIFHPGFVRTEMTGGKGHVEPAEAAAMLAERIDRLGPDSAGRFFHANGEELPW